MPDALSFDAIGFAGGGNRCYWQSGFFEAFTRSHPQKPCYYVAVSAGAYHCAMNLAGVGDRVRGAAFSFAEQNMPDLDWAALRQGRSPLVVGGLTCFGLSAVVWLFVLSRIPLSQAYPFVALGILVTVTAGAGLFGETISWQAMVGVGLIVVGVTLVGLKA